MDSRAVNGVASLALLAFLALLAGSPADALPAYRRLFEKQYGYAVSCTMCHAKGGGSNLNAYGLDFQKAGSMRDGFGRIGPKDSDGDRAPNSVEIEKKSNPGDPVSVPSEPGDWLARMEATALPVHHLQLIFPGHSSFSAVEGSLFPDQVAAIESHLGAKLDETDIVPTFYFAVQGAGPNAARSGVAVMLKGKGPHGPMVVATAVDRTNRISKIAVLAHAEDRALHGEAFAKEFMGKTAKDSLKVGQDLQAPEGLDEAASRVAAQVKKGLLVIQAVFEKKKKR